VASGDVTLLGGRVDLSQALGNEVAAPLLSRCCQEALGRRPVSGRRVSKCLIWNQKYGADGPTRTDDLLITSRSRRSSTTVHRRPERYAGQGVADRPDFAGVRRRPPVSAPAATPLLSNRGRCRCPRSGQGGSKALEQDGQHEVQASHSWAPGRGSRGAGTRRVKHPS